MKFLKPLAVEFGLADETEISLEGEMPKYEIPKYEALGIKRPVGARASSVTAVTSRSTNGVPKNIHHGVTGL